MNNEQLRIPGLTAPARIIHDVNGFVHVFAASVEDAYAGFGWAAGRERLWQIHLSVLYATGTAAAVLGPRFAAQDALMRTVDVPGRRAGRATGAGDALAEAYLAGLNAWIDRLDVPPPEFAVAAALPRRFTLDDLAARYRFMSFHQHRSVMEKLLLARLTAAHGIDRWRPFAAFTAADEDLARHLREPYAKLSLTLGPLFTPAASRYETGSNNWAVRAARSASGKPLLASDPHQPYTLPNTFFYVHLHAPGLDVMGASMPGMPYFMIGHTQHVAWGLTTGFTDGWDVYVERLNATRDAALFDDAWQPLRIERERIERKGAVPLDLTVECTRHGPLLEPLLAALEVDTARNDAFGTSLRWATGETRTPAGALARLPLARNVDEFGAALWDHGSTPLVNNIICVDHADGMARWIAACLPRRHGVSGMLPLAGWDSAHDFPLNDASEMVFDRDPAEGFAVTANNDTLGERAPFPIHNFPAASARADRIAERLRERPLWNASGFVALQCDLVDVHAREHVPPLLELLRAAEHPDARLAHELLAAWGDFETRTTAVAPTVWYALADTRWPLRFMQQALRADELDTQMLADLPYALMLNRWSVQGFSAPGSPWSAHHGLLQRCVQEAAVAVIARLRKRFGNDPQQWNYGRAHRIAFWHSQHRHAAFSAMRIEPQPIGGSANTPGMAVHVADTSGEGLWRVSHGPVMRFVFDFATPDRSQWVIAGGNSARPDSPFTMNQFPAWLARELLTVQLDPAAVLAEAAAVFELVAQ